MTPDYHLDSVSRDPDGKYTVRHEQGEWRISEQHLRSPGVVRSEALMSDAQMRVARFLDTRLARFVHPRKPGFTADIALGNNLPPDRLAKSLRRVVVEMGHSVYEGDVFDEYERRRLLNGQTQNTIDR